MKKILLITICFVLTACGYKITKIDLTDPQIQTLRKDYPSLESGFILLKIKNQEDKNESQEETVPNG